MKSCNRFVMGLILFTFAVIVFTWLLHRWRNRHTNKLIGKVPTNKWNTLMGFGKVLTSKTLNEGMYSYAEKYGPNSLLWMGPYPIFLTSDPDTLKDILTSKNCVDKPPEFYKGMFCVCGQGLITENEPVWSFHRKLVNKAFSNKNLISYLPTFNLEIDKFINELKENVAKGEDMDMLVKLRVLTLKNATKTTLKRDLDFTKYNSTSMAIYFEQILGMLLDYILHPVLTQGWFRNFLEPHVYKEATKGLQEFFNFFDDSLDLARKKDKGDESFLAEDYSVLDCCLQVGEQNALKDDEIHGLLMHFFLAAFETVSTTLYAALFLLAMHPECQARAYEEVLNVIGDKDTDLTVTQLDELTYLEMVLNETMRVVPIVPIVFRKVSNQDVTLSNGITLPAGQIIALNIFHCHRNKTLWGPEAENFNPDNFLPANAAARHPYAFIPFTKGHRFCIGWRYGVLFFKIAMCKLIKTFKFSTDFELKNLRFENHITMKLSEEPHLTAERR